MLAAVGDLVDDVVVALAGPINHASDTDASITRRRGGSAANVVATAARLTGRARFLGQVGTDAVGAALLAELADVGVDVDRVRRGGRTGTIVVLVDAEGERTMLVDAGSARDLDSPDSSWLDGVAVLHVPFYSLAGGAIAATSVRLADWARQRGIPVSIDTSSVAVLASYGVDRAREAIARLEPTIVFANRDEAELLGIVEPIGQAITIVKQGVDPALVHHRPDQPPVAVPAIPIDRAVDTTGAGDAFAAGILTHPDWRADPVAACAAGHAAAHSLLVER